MEKLFLNFDGLGVLVESTSEFLDRLRYDFSYYRADFIAQPAVEVIAALESPNFTAMPELYSTKISNRCMTYQESSTRWSVYYGGEGLSIWNTKDDKAHFSSLDVNLLHELVYLFILSRTGELFDNRGRHRIHAAAISYNGRAALLTMPSGGGKTTLSMSGMKLPGWRFMSDDSPYVARNGTVFAFPTRLGLQNPPVDIDDQLVRRFYRRQFGEKFLVDSSHFADRIEKQAEPLIFMIGYRKLSGDAVIFPISKWKAFRETISVLVVGVGLPQLIEYFLRLDFSDILSKIRIVVSRIIASFNLIRKSKTYGFALGTDVAFNQNLYSRFLTETFSTDIAQPSSQLSSLHRIAKR